MNASEARELSSSYEERCRQAECSLVINAVRQQAEAGKTYAELTLDPSDALLKELDTLGYKVSILSEKDSIFHISWE